MVVFLQISNDTSFQLFDIVSANDTTAPIKKSHKDKAFVFVAIFKP